MNDTKKILPSFEEMDEDIDRILEKANEKNIEYNKDIKEALEILEKKYKNANVEEIDGIKQVFGRQQRAHELTFQYIIRYVHNLWKNKEKKDL